MRMRRSILQCVTSFSQSSCDCAVHGVYPPSQAPRSVKHGGEGICCFTGLYLLSCAFAWEMHIAAVIAATRPAMFLFLIILTLLCLQLFTETKNHGLPGSGAERKLHQLRYWNQAGHRCRY